jgi:hypothetical protein
MDQVRKGSRTINGNCPRRREWVGSDFSGKGCCTSVLVLNRSQVWSENIGRMMMTEY